jgi:hypothetical protein
MLVPIPNFVLQTTPLNIHLCEIALPLQGGNKNTVNYK